MFGVSLDTTGKKRRQLNQEISQYIVQSIMIKTS
jgi:hypothetical protein